VTRRAQLGNAGSFNQAACAGTAFWVRATGTHRVAGENTLRRPPARSPAERPSSPPSSETALPSWSRAAALSTSLTVAWCPVQRRKVLPMCPVRPVTYVSGRSSNTSSESLESPQREVLTASHWGSPRRFGPRDVAESAKAPAPRRESARKRPSNTGQLVSRRRNPFGAARAIIHPLATPGTRMPSAPRQRCALKPSLYQHLAHWCTISAPARPQSHRVVPCNHRPMSVGKSRRSADIGRKKAATKQLV
jgi:hypothetical protein